MKQARGCGTLASCCAATWLQIGGLVSGVMLHLHVKRLLVLTVTCRQPGSGLMFSHCPTPTWAKLDSRKYSGYISRAFAICSLFSLLCRRRRLGVRHIWDILWFFFELFVFLDLCWTTVLKNTLRPSKSQQEKTSCESSNEMTQHVLTGPNLYTVYKAVRTWCQCTVFVSETSNWTEPEHLNHWAGQSKGDSAIDSARAGGRCSTAHSSDGQRMSSHVVTIQQQTQCSQKQKVDVEDPFNDVN